MAAGDRDERRGRRWKKLCWFSMEVDSNGRHVDHEPDLYTLIAWDPQYEYRMLYDTSKSLWRADHRKHVDGG